MFKLYSRDPARCPTDYIRTRLYYVVAPYDHTFRVGHDICTDRGTFRVTHPGRMRYIDDEHGRLSVSISVAADLPADVAAEVEAERVVRRAGAAQRSAAKKAFLAADPATLTVEQIFAQTTIRADMAKHAAEQAERSAATKAEIERIRKTRVGARTPADLALLQKDEKRRAERRAQKAARKARQGGTTAERIAAGKTRLAAYHALMRADPATLTDAERALRRDYKARISAGTRKGMAKRAGAAGNAGGVVVTPEQVAAAAEYLAQVMQGKKS